MAHSVSDHLHVMIADYDRFIRTVIPHYETMRAVQLELLARCLPPGGRVLDLGGGTGALARAVVDAPLPNRYLPAMPWSHVSHSTT